MNLRASIANSLWNAAGLPSYFRYRRALRRPGAVQLACLKDYVARNSGTEFGKAHRFNSIGSYEDFASRVPLMDDAGLESWVARIRRGDSRVLTHEPVTGLVPTSGSTGPRKLIPFTAGLQREFNEAIGPWLLDLIRQQPGLIGGPAYWSVTPVAEVAQTQDSKVPIGFDADTAYLGGAQQRLAAAVMAVPEDLRLIRNMEHFRYVTLLCLLRQRDLRLVSVWHPSFLELLLAALPPIWEDILSDIRSGRCKHSNVLPRGVLEAMNLRPLPWRADELRGASPQAPEALWPKLKMISCWADASAEFALTGLKSLFPNTAVQPKGLIATEAIVTIPFAGSHPLAIQSHFFEFIDCGGAVRLAHQLRAGECYEVVVTSAGGLWRYCLRDSVQVTGFVGMTPSLRFLGRNGNVSDLFGEKLSEAFVTETIREMFVTLGATPGFALLAPDKDATGCRYTLYIEGHSPGRLAEELDLSLRRNPHYSYCRDLGQLLPPRIFVIAGCGYEKFVDRRMAQGARLGEIKPSAFSQNDGWSNIFAGAYLPDQFMAFPHCASTPLPHDLQQ